MFKLIRRVIVFVLIAVIIFIVLAVWHGGKPFRWFGIKSEQAGEVLKEKSEEVGERADTIKKKTDDIKETTEKVSEGIQKSKKFIKDITNQSEEKDEE